MDFEKMHAQEEMMIVRIVMWGTTTLFFMTMGFMVMY
jgi:hypothetical protein